MNVKKKISKKCPTCGKDFLLFPHDFNIRKYCSRSCFGKSLVKDKNPNWKNGISCKKPFVKIDKIEKICQSCNKKFYTYPSRITAKFCSKECRGISMRNPDSPISILNIKLCLQCKSAIHPKLTFCSPECRMASSPKIVKRCPICLTEFKTWKNKPNIHCSRKCWGKAKSISQTAEGSHFWKGGMTDWRMRVRTHSLYKEWRNKVFKRDDYTCQSCLKKSSELIKGKLCAHHIKAFKDEPRLSLKVSNGITLCWQCHRDFHRLNSKGILDTDETALKEKCQKYFKTQSGVVFFKIHGDQFQEVGMPDFLGCVAGMAVGIELKIFPNFVTPIQKHQLKRIEAAGGKIFVCYSLEEVKRAIQIVKESVNGANQYELHFFKN